MKVSKNTTIGILLTTLMLTFFSVITISPIEDNIVKNNFLFYQIHCKRINEYVPTLNLNCDGLIEENYIGNYEIKKVNKEEREKLIKFIQSLK